MVSRLDAVVGYCTLIPFYHVKGFPGYEYIANDLIVCVVYIMLICGLRNPLFIKAIFAFTFCGNKVHHPKFHRSWSLHLAAPSVWHCFPYVYLHWSQLLPLVIRFFFPALLTVKGDNAIEWYSARFIILIHCRFSRHICNNPKLSDHFRWEARFCLVLPFTLVRRWCLVYLVVLDWPEGWYVSQWSARVLLVSFWAPSNVCSFWFISTIAAVVCERSLTLPERFPLVRWQLHIYCRHTSVTDQTHPKMLWFSLTMHLSLDTNASSYFSYCWLYCVLYSFVVNYLMLRIP